MYFFYYGIMLSIVIIMFDILNNFVFVVDMVFICCYGQEDVLVFLQGENGMGGYIFIWLDGVQVVECSGFGVGSYFI